MINKFKTFKLLLIKTTQFKTILFLINAIFLFMAVLACTTELEITPIPPDYLGSFIKESKSMPEPLTSLNPANAGSHFVRYFYYGSEKNPKRNVYQESNVEVITKSVNISSFFNNIKESYWGYDAKEVPINGKVWYPDGEGKYPLILCVHGNHSPYDYSEFGYAYLGELMASRGFIFATVDQNFLNARKGSENDARAILMLFHTKTILDWNEDKETPLYNKIDTDKVALIGHSRGGEAVVTASLFNKMKHYPENGNIRFNWNLPIKAVISLAPVEGQYRPAGRSLAPSYTDYLLLHGSHDGDVSSFKGSRFFNRNRPDEGRFRSSIWIYGANHSQFNTSWASTPDPKKTLKENLLKAEEQQLITKIFISSFLETSLKGNDEYLPLLKDYRKGLNWLPKTLYINKYQDSEGEIVADFEEDPDFITATYEDWYCTAKDLSKWYENPIPLPRGHQESWAMFVKWYKADDDDTPSFSFFTPDNPINGTDTLAFDVAFIRQYRDKTDPLDFTIKLTTKGEKTFETTLDEHFSIIPLPIVWIYNYYRRHIILQTVEIPLSETFSDWSHNYNIQSIEFIFDKTESSYIAFDNVILK